MKFIILALLMCGCSKAADGYFSSWQPYNHLTIKIDDSVPADYQEPILAAIKVWNDAAGYNLINLDKDSKNIIYYQTQWTRDPNEEAYTEAKTTSYGQITQASIYINANWVTLDKESLLIHELGHYLGMNHHDYGVMYPTLLPGQLRITLDSRDVQNIKNVYE